MCSIDKIHKMTGWISLAAHGYGYNFGTVTGD